MPWVGSQDVPEGGVETDPKLKIDDSGALGILAAPKSDVAGLGNKVVAEAFAEAVALSDCRTLFGGVEPGEGDGFAEPMPEVLESEANSEGTGCLGST